MIRVKSAKHVWLGQTCMLVHWKRFLPEMLTVGSPLSNIQQSRLEHHHISIETNANRRFWCSSTLPFDGRQSCEIYAPSRSAASQSKAKRLSPLSIDTVRVTKQVIADRKDEMQHTARDIHAMTNSCLPGNALSQWTARTCLQERCSRCNKPRGCRG